MFSTIRAKYRCLRGDGWVLCHHQGTGRYPVSRTVVVAGLGGVGCLVVLGSVLGGWDSKAISFFLSPSHFLCAHDVVCTLSTGCGMMLPAYMQTLPFLGFYRFASPVLCLCAFIFQLGQRRP